MGEDVSCDDFQEMVLRSFARTKEYSKHRCNSDRCPGGKIVVRGSANQGYSDTCCRRFMRVLHGHEYVERAREGEDRPEHLEHIGPRGAGRWLRGEEDEARREVCRGRVVGRRRPRAREVVRIRFAGPRGRPQRGAGILEGSDRRLRRRGGWRWIRYRRRRAILRCERGATRARPVRTRRCMSARWERSNPDSPRAGPPGTPVGK